MSVSLLVGRRKGAKIGELQLDATLNEIHEYDSEVSEYPIEEGSDISDNVRKLPASLQMTGLVSNTPINLLQENKAEIVRKSDGTIDVKNLKSQDGSTNVDFAQDELLKITGRKIDGEDSPPLLVDVITGLRVYTNMVLQNLRFPRDATTGQALRFDATLRELKKVKTKTIAIPEPKTVDKNLTQSTVDKGQLTPPQTEEEKAAKAESDAFKFGRNFRDAIVEAVVN